MNSLQIARALRWTALLLRNVADACQHTLLQIEGDLYETHVARVSAVSPPPPVAAPEDDEDDFDDHPPSDPNFMADANDD